MTDKIKYPHTSHLPFSPKVLAKDTLSDDRVMESLDEFIGHEIVVTEKMDGENTSMYRDVIHARSTDSKHHSSREIVKAIWGGIRHDIPINYRICGENLYAKHSIHYTNLTSYFKVFGVWSGTVCLSWQEIEEWSTLLGLSTVPILYKGLWDQKHIHYLIACLDISEQEGLVVRRSDSISIKDWPKRVGKWVRRFHVQTSEHWMRQAIIPNKLIGE